LADTLTAPRTGADERSSRRRTAARRTVGLAVGAVAVAATAVASLALGSNPVPFADVFHVLLHPDSSEAGYVVHSLRIPRTVVGLLAGAALGIAGALMQALSRNPLADPGLLGVTSGASLGVAVGVAAFGLSGPSEYVWVACAGAFVAAGIVFAIGASGKATSSPTRLVLAGVALTAILTGITFAISLMYPLVFASYRSWTVGSLVGREISASTLATPLIAIGIVAALALGRPLGAVALGESHAQAVGVNVGRTRTASLLTVTLLCGGATALAGPIAFIGLMIPHAVRRFTGPNQPWTFAFSALYGPVTVLGADVLGRIVARPAEFPVGFMTALIGGPFLIVLLLRGKALRL
jgi:iron complex transport system permease protein